MRTNGSVRRVRQCSSKVQTEHIELADRFWGETCSAAGSAIESKPDTMTARERSTVVLCRREDVSVGLEWSGRFGVVGSVKEVSHTDG